MDYESRIAKAEAIMETNRQDIDRLYQSISELRKLILERSDNFQAELAALRKHMDERFDEQRKYIDDSLKEVRSTMEAGFKEVRHDASVNLRWAIGLALLNTSMILGMGGKMFGLY